MKSKKLDINNWSVKSLLIILFFLLIIIVVLWKFVLSNHKVSAAWWNDGWNYRKAIPVTNTLGSTVNNQIVKIIIDTSALVTAGKLQSDCDDIRITDINGNLLDHWDTGCNTTTTNIYFKLSSIPTSGTTTYFYYGNSSANNSEKILGNAETPGTSCQMMKDQGSVTTNGTYYIVPGGNSVDKQFVYCDQTTDGGGWALVMNQKSDTGGFFVNSTEAQSYNESNPTADRYSILGKLSKFKDNGIFTFKLNWPTLDSSRNIWSQTSNPISETIAGYTAITIDHTDNVWGGIAPSGASTFIDGSPSDSTWYYAIASYTIWSGGIPAYNPMSIQTQLWVKGNNTMNNVSVGTPSAEEAGGGPIAYWKFDEGTGTTAYDSTTNQNNGVFGPGSSAPTWQTEDMCISGKCLRFNGTNQYLDTTKTFNFTDLTISAWVKIPSNFPSGNRVGNIIGNYAASNNINFEINTSGRLRVYWNNGEIDLSGTKNLIDGKWHNVMFVRNKTTNTITLYIDNKYEAQSTAGSDINQTSKIFRIGGDFRNGDPPNAPGIPFTGSIDDIKIYPYARSAAQIKLDYNSRGSSKGTSANLGGAASDNNLSDGLVGYWKMDEGIGTTTADSSGNSNTGTFGTGTSAPTWSNGKYGIGLSFDGSNTNYVQKNTPSNFPTTAISSSFWIKTADSSNGVISYASSVSDNDFLLFDTSNLNFQIRGSSVSSGVSVNDNLWHHIVTTWQSSNGEVKIYKDGNLSYTGTVSSGQSITSGGCLIFGQEQDAICGSFETVQAFNGNLDEIRIYNRALSPSEVFQLYEYAPGPIGYWDLNEASGTTINDKSGNNLTGTFGIGSSAPSWSSGKYGGGVDFSPTTKFINIPAGAPFQTNTSGRSFSYSLWFKSKDVSAASQYLITNNEPCNNPGSFSIKLSSGTISFDYYSLSLPGAVSHSFTPSITLQNNTWYHLEWTKTFGQLGVKAYLNGIPQTISGDSTATGNTTSRILLGAYNGTGSTCTGGVTDSPPVANMSLKGSLDDVKIYNYIRTQKQIIEDMTSGAPAVSSKSMIAYYKFDEGSGTTANNSGNGGSALNGTFGTGSSAPTWTNDGKFNKALSFNGVNNYIQGSSSSLLKPTNITISAWAKTSDSKSTQFIGGYGNTGVLGYWLGAGSSQFVFSVGNGSSNKQLSSNFTSNDNNWHHIIGTYDGSTQKIFIDGNLKNTSNTVTGDLSYGTLTNGFLIGNAEGLNSARFWSGSIDELKIYNYALSENEVKQDYNQGSALQMGQTSQTISGTTTSLEYCIPGDTSPCASPVAEWNFEENTGTTTKDSSGNNNTGTLINSPTWTVGQNNKGASLKFDGVDDRVLLNSTINIGNIDWTVSAWIKTTATGVNSILSNSSGGPVFNDLRTDTSKIVYYHYNNAWLSEYGTSNIADGQWHYLTWANHNNQTIDLYVDGIREVTGAPSTLSDGNVGPVNQIGRNWSVSANASIDNVRVYNYARTPAQIAYDYNKGGPIGWWKFDECQGSVANDSSGMGNTGSINVSASGTQTSVGTCTTSGTAWGNGANGHINSSLNFDGTDDYIEITTTNKLDGFTQMSVFFWAKPLENTTNEMITKWAGGTYNNWELFQSNSNITGRINAGGDCSSTGNFFTIGNWHQIGMVWDGSNIYMYIDGIKRSGSCPRSTTMVSSTSPLDIGRISGSDNTYQFPGQFDDVRIYNYALTPEQVKTLYNGGAVNFN
ncbi:MAG: DUF2341 domain-containing protein [Candidatus Shapirobacteria bacterium]|nr:DUF2341 domain-containing protein [Candidatus Shapirobacteria bacterium]